MFHDLHNVNHKVWSFFFSNFIQYVLSLLFYDSKCQFTCHQPISLTDIGWRVKHVKRLMSLCLQNMWLRFTLFWNFTQTTVDCLTPGTDRLPRNVGNKLRCVTSQKSADILHRGGSLISRKTYFLTVDLRGVGVGCCGSHGCAPCWSCRNIFKKLLHLATCLDRSPAFWRRMLFVLFWKTS